MCIRKDKGRYQSNIITYTKRRKNYWDKYNETKNEKYLSAIRNITKKISTWKKAVKRIEDYEKRINNLRECVNEYFQVSIESKCMDSQHKEARGIFYKIGMESNMQGVRLAENINRTGRMAFRGRLSITKSFKKSNDIRKKFHQFKRYFEQH